MGSAGNKVSKYLKIALRLAGVVAVLAAICFIIRIYSFITLRLESSLYHGLAYELVHKLAERDLPDGEIKYIPVFKFERLPERIVKDGKYVDRWGNPLDIKIVKEDGRCTVTIISHGRGRWFFSREDIEVTQIIGLPRPSDDVADIKAVILKDAEFGVKGDFAEKLALYAPDYVQIHPDGTSCNYEFIKWLLVAFDGKHPEEFMLAGATMEHNGVMPSAELRAEIRKAARDPGFIKRYEAICPAFFSAAQTKVALRLKTQKFVSVQVDGDQATVVIEYDTKDENGAVRHEMATCSLRRVNGKWIFYRIVRKR